MNKYYTGVGSRDISSEEYSLIVKIAERMSDLGYVLRTGGAQGSDSAFMEGCRNINPNMMEVWSPWVGFCKGETDTLTLDEKGLARQFFIKKGIIPWFDDMKQGAKRLHERNYFQVVGRLPLSKVCIFCSDEEKGEPVGGTRSAVLTARNFGVPTYNLRNEGQRDNLMEKLFPDVVI